MEARSLQLLCSGLLLCLLGASVRTPNFIVTAPTPQFADQVARAAETYRKSLALEWIGYELPAWSQPCPINVEPGMNLGAGGATTFSFHRGEVFGWHMTIQGSPQRILDSVLPHEVTHTIFASHFRRPLPRWADEGACTTVEHPGERLKQHHFLIDFLKTGRGIAFNQLFAMKEYPRDVMPLYSQGYSLCRFLIAQGGKQLFVKYLETGMEHENWTSATREYYGFENLSLLQNSWLEWVKTGSPEPLTPHPGSRSAEVLLVSREQAATESVSDARPANRPSTAPGRYAPLANTAAPATTAAPANTAAPATTAALANTGAPSNAQALREKSPADGWYSAGQARARAAALAAQGSSTAQGPFATAAEPSPAAGSASAADEVSAYDGRSAYEMRTPESTNGPTPAIQAQAARPQPPESTQQMVLEYDRAEESTAYPSVPRPGFSPRPAATTAPSRPRPIWFDAPVDSTIRR